MAWITCSLRSPRQVVHLCHADSGGLLSALIDAPGYASSTTWHATNRFARPRIALRAGKPAFQGSERFDNLRCLEGPVATTNADLSQAACIHQPRNGLVGLDEAPRNQIGSALNGDHGRSGEPAQEKICCRPGTDPDEALTPVCLDRGSGDMGGPPRWCSRGNRREQYRTTESGPSCWSPRCWTAFV